MRRRHLLLGIGLVAGTGAVVSSGAFSATTSQREVAVAVESDADAYLQMRPTPDPAGNGEYATETSDRSLRIDLSGENDAVTGDGINSRAVTTIADVFRIGNQGTQALELDVEPVVFPEDNVAVSLVPQGADPTRPVELPPGAVQRFGLVTAAFESIDPPTTSAEFRIRAGARA